MTLPTRRLRTCVENWPDAKTGSYDPRCCRFPKSCSATVYGDETPEEYLEPAEPTPPLVLPASGFDGHVLVATDVECPSCDGGRCDCLGTLLKICAQCDEEWPCERVRAYQRGRSEAAAELVALADRLDGDCAGHGVASAHSNGLRNAADVLAGESWLLKRSTPAIAPDLKENPRP